MPPFEATVQCSKCNCCDIYDTNYHVDVGDDWPDPCKDCGSNTGNEIISVEASDD